MMKITTSGQLSSFMLAGGGNRCPQWVTLGPDGAIWFTELGINVGGPLAQLGRIDTSGNISEFALPAGDAPIGLASAKDGNLWYDTYTPNSNSIFVRGFSPVTHAVIGSVSNNLLNPILDFFNSVVVNPSDGNLIVSGGNPVFRVVPGTNPTIAGNIALPAGCQTASIGTDSNIYYQCAAGKFSGVSQTTYAVQSVLEQPFFQRADGKNQAFYDGPMVQGSNGLLYTWGGCARIQQFGFPGLLALGSDGLLRGYYSAGPHEQLVQGVAGPDGANWFTVEDLYGAGYILRISP